MVDKFDFPDGEVSHSSAALRKEARLSGEEVQIDPVEELAQQMGWSSSEVWDAVNSMGMIRDWEQMGEDQRREFLLNGENCRLNLNTDTVELAKILCRLSFGSLEEAIGFLEENDFFPGVIDPADESRLVVPDNDFVLTERCGDRVIFRPEVVLMFVNMLISRKKAALATKDARAWVMWDNEERRDLLEEHMGEEDEDMVRRIESYLDDSLYEPAELALRYPLISQGLMCPSPEDYLDPERKEEVWQAKSRFRGAEFAEIQHFQGLFYGGGNGYDARVVHKSEVQADKIASLRTNALLFRHLVGEDPLPLMREFFMIELLATLAEFGITGYEDICDPELREKALAIMGDAEVSRWSRDVRAQSVSDMKAMKLKMLEQEIIGDARERIIFIMNAQGLEWAEAEDLFYEEARYKLEKLMRHETRRDEQKIDRIKAFLEEYPDPRDFVDHIMGARGGELLV